VHHTASSTYLFNRYLALRRFHDGRRIKRKFDASDVVRSLYEYVELEFGADPTQVLICTTMPRVSCCNVCRYGWFMFFSQTEIACSDAPLIQQKVQSSFCWWLIWGLGFRALTALSDCRPASGRGKDKLINECFSKLPWWWAA
jgi:hypothetical protein